MLILSHNYEASYEVYWKEISYGIFIQNGQTFHDVSYEVSKKNASLPSFFADVFYPENLKIASYNLQSNGTSSFLWVGFENHDIIEALMDLFISRYDFRV